MESEENLVKLYVLSDSGNWDDHGTGFLSIYQIEGDEENEDSYKLVIRNNETDSILLESELDASYNYQRREDTLMAWEENGTEYAISFKGEDHCEITYETICKSLAAKNGFIIPAEDHIEENETSNATVQTSDINFSKYDNLEETFPSLDFDHLEEIALIFLDACNSPLKRNQLADLVESRNILPSILQLFHLCEDLEDNEGLHCIYNIIKVMFSFTKFSIYEMMLSNDCIIDIIGILEYSHSSPVRIDHRKILKDSKYTELVPYSNKNIRNLIIHTFRLQYIHDILVPTPSIFDERGTLLSSFIFFRKNEIVESILQDDIFLDEFFRSLVDDEIDEQLRQKLTKFLSDLCSFTRLVQNEKRELFLSKLIQYEVVSISLRLLNMNDQKIRCSVIEVLSKITENHPSLLRQAIISAPDMNSQLFLHFFDEFTTNPDSNSSLLSVQIVKSVLETLSANKDEVLKVDIADFLSSFYSNCMNFLMSPLFSYTANGVLKDEKFAKALSVENVIDVFITCLEYHSSHIKNYVLRSDTFKSIVILLKSKFPFLAHIAVKTIRKAIGLQQDFFNRYLMRESILDHLVLALQTKHKKYDIVNSALLEVFEAIRTIDPKVFVLPLVERHRDFFMSVTYTTTFKKLISTSEALYNDRSIVRTPSIGLRKSVGFRSICFEAKEEAWFDEETKDQNHKAKDLPEITETPLVVESNNVFTTRNENGSIEDDDFLSTRPKMTDDDDFPSIQPKMTDDDDFLEKNNFKPISQPSIKICLKRNIEEASRLSTNIIKENNPPRCLVDYPDDDDSPLPPCDDFTIEDIKDADIPSNKKPKIIDSL